MLDTPGVSTERDISEVTLKTRNFRSTSLKKQFKEYLDAHEMDPAATDASGSTSVLEASVSSSVISQEARQLLNGEMGLSESMFAVMNGDDPDDAAASSPAPPPLPTTAPPKVPVTPSVLEPVDVDSFLELSGEKENEHGGSFVSARSEISTYSSASTLPPTDIPLPVRDLETSKVSTKSLMVGGQEEEDVSSGSEDGAGGLRKGRKRRSLTEISELNPMSHASKASAGGGGSQAAGPRNNIYFETDL